LSRKARISVVMSVRVYQRGSHWTNFCEIDIGGFFLWRSVEKIWSWLISGTYKLFFFFGECSQTVARVYYYFIRCINYSLIVKSSDMFISYPTQTTFAGGGRTNSVLILGISVLINLWSLGLRISTCTYMYFVYNILPSPSFPSVLSVLWFLTDRVLWLRNRTRLHAKQSWFSSCNFQLVSYFLSLLADHMASFQRFLGLEVCIL
jgi:hypothetical protein